MALGDQEAIWVLGESQVTDNDHPIWVLGESWYPYDTTYSPAVGFPAGIQPMVTMIMGGGR